MRRLDLNSAIVDPKSKKERLTIALPFLLPPCCNPNFPDLKISYPRQKLMAEAAALSAFLRMVIEKATSLLIHQSLRICGADVRRDLSKLESNLSTVQAVLGDAEKQVRNRALKQWLSKLKDAAYDADDVLDDLDSRVLRREAAGNNKVRRFFSSGSPLVFSVGMGQRVREVVERFNEIAEERSKFLLSPADYSSSSSRITAAVSGDIDRRETHSFVVELGVIGRREDVNRIVEILINLNNGNSTSSVSVLPIVGMGGLGKTTLAQMVYNEQRVVERFELRMWVCVSDEFNAKKLIKTIIESGNGKCDDKTMDSLQRSLREMLATKRYLLVLDDVWNEEPIKWEELAILLSSGSRGSALIVTTRSATASSIMGTLETYRLTHLSLEDCWALFRNRAFAEGTEERLPKLVEIGRAIVKKLGGLPLAVKTVGSLMRFKTDESQWLSVLQSEIWNIPAGEKDILPALRLSYNHLPSHLKQCFAYCAIFPKDSVLEKEVLIQLWMANGFIPSGGRMELEVKGAEIFNELASRFFFQGVEEVRKPSFVHEDICTTATCKMHDLIHDLARDVMGSEFCIIDSNEQLNGIHTGTTRHVTLSGRLPSKTMAQVTHKSYKTIRTIFTLRDAQVDVGRDMWLKLKSARVLALRGANFMNACLFSFPKDKLKHLRYLDLSYTNIETLPVSVNCLFHLQTLKLQGCRKLRELPSGIGSIRSLRHLYTDGCYRLTCMPRGMGKLSSLQTLSMYVVGRKAGSGSIIELKELDIGGRLELYKLRNVRSAVVASEVRLSSKQNIRDLVLSWGEESTLEDQCTNNGSEVIEALQPHHNLRYLTINYFGGIRFPNWLVNGQVFLPNLVEIRLSNCIRCKHLPPFGLLPSLEVLELEHLKEVECIAGGNSAMYGNGGGSMVGLFPSLKELSLYGMTSLEEWTTLDMGVTGSSAFFPRLAKLVIIDCPKLKTMPGFLPCVEYLNVQDCPLLLPEKETGFFPTMKSLRDLTLRNCDKLTLLLEEEHTGGPLTSTSTTLLRKLYIARCNSSMFSAASVGFWKNLGTSLEDLSFYYCDGLVSLPEELLCCLGSVKKLVIEYCENLESGSSSSLQSSGVGGGGGGGEVGLQLQHLTSLEDLSIGGCGKLAGVPLERLTALRRLFLTHREGQEALPKCPPCLQVLDIEDCPNLESLPPERIGCLTALQELSITFCPKLTCLPDGLEGLTQLEGLTIVDCPKLTSLPQGLQQRLPSLRRLWIDGCPSLQRQYGEAGGEGWHLVSTIPERDIERHGCWSLQFCD